jgi:Uma2 family endonuclease
VAVRTPLTVAEFDRLAELPENADKRLEFIGGEVIEVPSNAYSSELAITVEVVSPNDDNEKLLIKVSNYLAAGTVVWIVRPGTQKVEVHAPGQPVKVLGIQDTFDGGQVLPGFKLAIKDLFAG